ncbi:ATP-binding protein [Pseudonocardia sp. CA-107938]|uniref:ATP-binding protein n=1 Tax=Pseudonocardia sp. CA-107938 TaxID=3240021 RepID=UPI003D8CF654
MKIENTRVAHAVALQHRCAFYASPKHLTTQLMPMLAATLARGTTVALALAPDTAAAVEDVLGPSRQLVPLAEPPSGIQSGQTLAAQRARELRELIGEHGPVAMVGQHRSEFDGADGSFWTELDAAYGIALADMPVELTCFYPELPLHQAILDGARRTHPALLVGGTPVANAEHLCPRTVLAEHPAPSPTLLGAPDVQLEFGAWQLNEMRQLLEQSLLTAGYGRNRAEDLVLAVNEVATNAVEYGSADARLYVWLDGDGITDGAVCEIHDRGTLRDPLPGLAAPHSSDPRGRGVWIARQICESLHVWSDRSGTHVRLHAGRPV